MILENNNVLYYKFGSSISYYLQLRPNDLLYRTLIQYGSDNGFNTIDLGFSGTAKTYEGLIRFKSKESGDKTPIYKIEHIPTGVSIDIINKKINCLDIIVKKTIDSNNIDLIREISKLHYHKFA